jgi:hypothetical protein
LAPAKWDVASGRRWTGFDPEQPKERLTKIGARVVSLTRYIVLRIYFADTVRR